HWGCFSCLIKLREAIVSSLILSPASYSLLSKTALTFSPVSVRVPLIQLTTVSKPAKGVPRQFKLMKAKIRHNYRSSFGQAASGVLIPLSPIKRSHDGSFTSRRMNGASSGHNSQRTNRSVSRIFKRLSHFLFVSIRDFSSKSLRAEKFQVES